MKNLFLKLLSVQIFAFSLSYSQEASLSVAADTSIHLEAALVESKYYKKYNPKLLSSSLRLPAGVLKSTQNIQIISAEVFRDQHLYSLTEGVTRNVSGAFREELHNMISADIYARGGYMSVMRNGVDVRPLGKGPLSDDLAAIENIEFIKGPSSFLNAISDPAGAYNMNLKYPTGMTRNRVELASGSYGLMRVSADLEGKLEPNNRLQYRLNLMGSKSDGFIDHDYKRRLLINPSIYWKVSDNNFFTASYVYQDMNNMLMSEAQISPYGYGSLPRNFSITDPSIRPYQGSDHSLYITNHQHFAKGWSMTNKAAYINNRYSGSIFWVNGANPDQPHILDRVLVLDNMHFQVASLQSFVQGEFHVGSSKQQLQFGVDFNGKRSHNKDTWGTAAATIPLDINNPTYSLTRPGDGSIYDADTENSLSDPANNSLLKLYYISPYVHNESLFMQERLRIAYGLRLTYANGTGNQYGVASKRKDLVLSPRVGVNYSLSESSSIYGLYDQTFVPQVGLDQQGQGLKPIHGRSLEFGVKQEWFAGQLSTTLSAYSLNRSNLISTHPEGNLKTQHGESRAEGIEVDIKGKLSKRLHIIFNYAYTDSKITKDELNPARVGLATPNLIRHIQNTWINYQLPLPGTIGSNTQVSLGYQYLAGRHERYSSNTAAPLADIFRVDAAIAWQRNNYSINFMLNNLMDRAIYSTAWRNNSNDLFYWVQQPGRNFRVSLGLNF